MAISGALAGRLVDWQAEALASGADAEGYVWPGRGGRAMNAHSPNQALARALARAGLVDAAGMPLVSPHGLRHTTASLMLAAGVPLIVVSRQLGHANPNITAQVYAHLLGDERSIRRRPASRTPTSRGHGGGGSQGSRPAHRGGPMTRAAREPRQVLGVGLDWTRARGRHVLAWVKAGRCAPRGGQRPR